MQICGLLAESTNGMKKINGAVIAFEALFAGPVSGASMNPARSLGPAILAGEMDSLWVYLIAPIIGAMLAVPLYRFIHRH